MSAWPDPDSDHPRARADGFGHDRGELRRNPLDLCERCGAAIALAID
jgi:hypothetical protein